MSKTLGCQDAMLLASLLYSCFDLQAEWDSFSTCSRPIHMWLFVSYSCVLFSRLTYLLGSRAAAAGAGQDGHAASEFLLDFRQKGAVPRVMLSFTWAAALPCFAFLTVLGTSWMVQVVRATPQCMPSEIHFWFSVMWLLLCYVWISIYALIGIQALVVERRVRRAEGDLREIEDDDVRQRWGEVSQLSGQNIRAHAAASGLCPASIKALPCHIHSDACMQAECSICIMDMEPGEAVRCLPGCGHCFHRSCIDLWLLRRADCPLCKTPVVKSKDNVWV